MNYIKASKNSWLIDLGSGVVRGRILAWAMSEFDADEAPLPVTILGITTPFPGNRYAYVIDGILENPHGDSGTPMDIRVVGGRMLARSAASP